MTRPIRLDLERHWQTLCDTLAKALADEEKLLTCSLVANDPSDASSRTAGALAESGILHGTNNSIRELTRQDPARRFEKVAEFSMPSGQLEGEALPTDTKEALAEFARDAAHWKLELVARNTLKVSRSWVASPEPVGPRLRAVRVSLAVTTWPPKPSRFTTHESTGTTLRIGGEAMKVVALAATGTEALVVAESPWVVDWEPATNGVTLFIVQRALFRPPQFLWRIPSFGGSVGTSSSVRRQRSRSQRRGPIPR